MAKRPHMLRNPLCQFLQPGPQDLVIIPPPRINGHHRFSRPRQPREFPRLPVGIELRRLGRQIVHARSDHAHSAGHQLGRSGPFEPVGCHEMHVPMKACSQPGR